MNKRLKLKPFVLPSIYLVLVVSLVTIIFMGNKSQQKQEEVKIDYVTNSIVEEDIPVVNTETKLIRPYTDTNVEVGKYFYDYQAEQDKQEKSIVYHEDTYMQNSGIDFVLDKTFDVISVLEGTVISVKKDDLLGNIVEIQHENDLISVYQSLSEVTVKKDDIIPQGQVIGKSGENKLDAALKNHLHFELFSKGQVVNPENYFDKAIKGN